MTRTLTALPLTVGAIVSAVALAGCKSERAPTFVSSDDVKELAPAAQMQLEKELEATFQKHDAWALAGKGKNTSRQYDIPWSSGARLGECTTTSTSIVELVIYVLK